MTDAMAQIIVQRDLIDADQVKLLGFVHEDPDEGFVAATVREDPVLHQNGDGWRAVRDSRQRQVRDVVKECENLPLQTRLGVF